MSLDMSEDSVSGGSTEADAYESAFSGIVGTFAPSPVHEAAAKALAPVAGRRILDIGCGEGELVQLLAEQEALPVGADYVGAAIATARERVPGARFEVADARKLPFDDEAFDDVVALGVIGYLAEADRALFLAECRRVLAPGGRLLLRVSPPASAIGHGLLALLRPGYVSQARRLGTRILKRESRAAGLRLIRSWLSLDRGDRQGAREIMLALLFPFFAQRWILLRR